MTCGILLTACLPGAGTLSAPGPVTALDLRTDSRTEPAGLETHHLRFSWCLEHAVRQSAWQVQVAEAENDVRAGQPALWDSGRSGECPQRTKNIGVGK